VIGRDCSCKDVNTCRFQSLFEVRKSQATFANISSYFYGAAGEDGLLTKEELLLGLEMSWLDDSESAADKRNFQEPDPAVHICLVTMLVESMDSDVSGSVTLDEFKSGLGLTDAMNETPDLNRKGKFLLDIKNPPGVASCDPLSSSFNRARWAASLVSRRGGQSLSGSSTGSGTGSRTGGSGAAPPTSVNDFLRARALSQEGGRSIRRLAPERGQSANGLSINTVPLGTDVSGEMLDRLIEHTTYAAAASDRKMYPAHDVGSGPWNLIADLPPTHAENPQRRCKDWVYAKAGGPSLRLLYAMDAPVDCDLDIGAFGYLAEKWEDKDQMDRFRRTPNGAEPNEVTLVLAFADTYMSDARHPFWKEMSTVGTRWEAVNAADVPSLTPDSHIMPQGAHAAAINKLFLVRRASDVTLTVQLTLEELGTLHLTDYIGSKPWVWLKVEMQVSGSSREFYYRTTDHLQSVTFANDRTDSYQVHRWFYKSWQDAWQSGLGAAVEARINEVLQEPAARQVKVGQTTAAGANHAKRTVKVICVGHGVGAAHASLSALHLSYFSRGANIHLTSIGGPMVIGDPTGGVHRQITKKLAIQWIRLSSLRDELPFMPKVKDLVQVGSPYYTDKEDETTGFSHDHDQHRLRLLRRLRISVGSANQEAFSGLQGRDEEARTLVGYLKRLLRAAQFHPESKTYDKTFVRSDPPPTWIQAPTGGPYLDACPLVTKGWQDIEGEYITQWEMDFKGGYNNGDKMDATTGQGHDEHVETRTRLSLSSLEDMAVEEVLGPRTGGFHNGRLGLHNGRPLPAAVPNVTDIDKTMFTTAKYHTDATNDLFVSGPVTSAETDNGYKTTRVYAYSTVVDANDVQRGLPFSRYVGNTWVGTENNPDAGALIGLLKGEEVRCKFKTADGVKEETFPAGDPIMDFTRNSQGNVVITAEQAVQPGDIIVGGATIQCQADEAGCPNLLWGHTKALLDGTHPDYQAVSNDLDKNGFNFLKTFNEDWTRQDINSLMTGDKLAEEKRRIRQGRLRLLNEFMVLAAKEEARTPSPQLTTYTYRAYRYDVFEVQHSPTMATHFLEEYASDNPAAADSLHKATLAIGVMRFFRGFNSASPWKLIDLKPKPYFNLDDFQKKGKRLLMGDIFRVDCLSEKVFKKLDTNRDDRLSLKTELVSNLAELKTGELQSHSYNERMRISDTADTPLPPLAIPPRCLATKARHQPAAPFLIGYSPQPSTLNQKIAKVREMDIAWRGSTCRQCFTSREGLTGRSWCVVNGCMDEIDDGVLNEVCRYNYGSVSPVIRNQDGCPATDLANVDQSANAVQAIHRSRTTFTWNGHRVIELNCQDCAGNVDQYRRVTRGTLVFCPSLGCLIASQTYALRACQAGDSLAFDQATALRFCPPQPQRRNAIVASTIAGDIWTRSVDVKRDLWQKSHQYMSNTDCAVCLVGQTSIGFTKVYCKVGTWHRCLNLKLGEHDDVQPWMMVKEFCPEYDPFNEFSWKIEPDSCAISVETYSINGDVTGNEAEDVRWTPHPAWSADTEPGFPLYKGKLTIAVDTCKVNKALFDAYKTKLGVGDDNKTMEVEFMASNSLARPFESIFAAFPFLYYNKPLLQQTETNGGGDQSSGHQSSGESSNPTVTLTEAQLLFKTPVSRHLAGSWNNYGKDCEDRDAQKNCAPPGGGRVADADRSFKVNTESNTITATDYFPKVFRGQANSNSVAGPTHNGITIRQFSAFLDACRAEPLWDILKATSRHPGNFGWSPFKAGDFVNAYDLRGSFLHPWCKGTGEGVGLLMNPTKPREASVFITHAWAEDMEQAEDMLKNAAAQNSDPNQDIELRAKLQTSSAVLPASSSDCNPADNAEQSDELREVCDNLRKMIAPTWVRAIWDEQVVIKYTHHQLTSSSECAGSFIVSGAGYTKTNGRYLRIAHPDGNPYYKKVDGRANAYIFYKRGWWYISYLTAPHRVPELAKKVYQQQSSAGEENPPAGGWKSIAAEHEPAPTIAKQCDPILAQVDHNEYEITWTVSVKQEEAQALAIFLQAEGKPFYNSAAFMGSFNAAFTTRSSRHPTMAFASAKACEGSKCIASQDVVAVEIVKGTVPAPIAALTLDTVIWFCVFANHQAAEMEAPGRTLMYPVIGPNGPTFTNMNAFGLVIQNPDVGKMLALQVAELDLYSRIWCVLELYMALTSGVVVELLTSERYMFNHMPKLILTTPSQTDWNALKVDLTKAKLGSMIDYLMILQVLMGYGDDEVARKLDHPFTSDGFFDDDAVKRDKLHKQLERVYKDKDDPVARANWDLGGAEQHFPRFESQWNKYLEDANQNAVFTCLNERVLSFRQAQFRLMGQAFGIAQTRSVRMGKHIRTKAAAEDKAAGPENLAEDNKYLGKVRAGQFMITSQLNPKATDVDQQRCDNPNYKTVEQMKQRQRQPS
jgi:hypothetical protein